jgi:alcohol dehydrogenase class IV
MRFEFAAASRILFGEGVLSELGGIARSLGAPALLVTGATPVRTAPVRELLVQAGVPMTTCAVAREPDAATVLACVDQARATGAALVIGCGGGSVLDAAKAIAALATNPGDIYDYLEVIGRGRPLANPALPIIALPTTAGTGSEVTRNAVIFAPEQQVKVSLRSPYMLPRVALVDPELTYSLPPDVTAATGMDALTQLIEPFVSVRANPLTDAICREGIRRAVGGLRRACIDGGDVSARCDMAFASLCGGLALANAGLGAVHGFASPFGGMYAAPHGAVCAALLPAVCAANIQALRDRQPDAPALARYGEVARMLTGNPSAGPEAVAPWLDALRADLHIPRLRAYGFTLADAPALITKAQAASSMKANPLPLTDNELAAILEQAIG